MTAALIVARLVLAAVFAVAGAAKLADRDGAREAARGFGVPDRLARPLAIALPVYELAVAATLLWPASARWGAIAAAVLLAAFVAAMVRSLRRGEAPDCHCFGALHSEPVGPATIVRNAVLLALALFVAIAASGDAGGSVVAWIGDLSATGALAIACALGFLVVARAHLALLRQHGRLLLRLEALEGGGGAPVAAAAKGLPVGSPAPAFSLAGVRGDMQTLASLRSRGKPVLLVFSDPQCGPCNALLPDVGRWQDDDALSVVLLSTGSAEANRAKADEHGLHTVLLDADEAMWAPYRISGTPSAVAVGADGSVLAPLAEGADEIVALVERLGVAPGTSATLDVVQVDAAEPVVVEPDLRDRLLLFWDPRCGFCVAMLADLRAALAATPDLRVSVITRHPLADDEQLPAEVLRVDADFALGQRLGVVGTPGAVAIDADGRPASPVATGADEVLGLLAGAAAR